MVEKDTEAKRDPWPPAARMVIAVLAIGMGLSWATGAVGFIRASDAIDRTNDTAAAAAIETKCNSDWKKAYREAQPPRLAAQTRNLKSQLKFYKDIRDQTRAAYNDPPATREQQIARGKALDASITAAYNAVAKQLNAQGANAYPTDECGKETSVPAPAPQRTLGPSTKEKSNDKAPVDSGGLSGHASSGSNSSQRVGVGPATNSHGGSGGGGSGSGNGGGPTPGGGGGKPPVAQSPLGPLLNTLCSVLRVVGCSS
jgi:hypothetical protein